MWIYGVVLFRGLYWGCLALWKLQLSERRCPPCSDHYGPLGMHQEDPPPCNSGMRRISEDPDRIPIIPYSHYYWVGGPPKLCKELWISCEVVRDYPFIRDTTPETSHQMPRGKLAQLHPPANESLKPPQGEKKIIPKP